MQREKKQFHFDLQNRHLKPITMTLRERNSLWKLESQAPGRNNRWEGSDEDGAGFSAELIGQTVDPGETGHLDWREPAKAPRGGLVELAKEFGRVPEQRIPASIFPNL